MDLKQLVLLAFQVSIVCTVFGFGLSTTFDDLLQALRRPGLLLRAVLAVYVIVPAVAIAIAKGFDLPAPVEIALVALAISPVPPMLPKKIAKAGGRQASALGLMVLLAALAVVVVPLAASVLGSVFDRPFRATSDEMARLVFKSVFAPLAAGLVVRWLWPGVASRLRGPLVILARVLLPVAAVVLLATSWAALPGVFANGAIFALIAFVVAGFAIGHVLGGPEEQDSVALAFASACRHPAIALFLASANYPGERFGGTVLLYLIVSGVVGAVYSLLQRRWGHRSDGVAH